MYFYSDLKSKNNIIEPTYTKKNFFRKISIFNDGNLNKNISYLKESILKKNQFLQKYDDSEKTFNKNINHCFKDKKEINDQRVEETNVLFDDSVFFSQENKRRKNYSLDLNSIFKIKNINSGKILNYDEENLKEKSHFTNIKIGFNNCNSFEEQRKVNLEDKPDIYEQIYNKLNKNDKIDNSYKNFTNFKTHLSKFDKLDKNEKEENYNKNIFYNFNNFSENSYFKINKNYKLSKNKSKIYSLDYFDNINDSNISNNLFKKKNLRNNYKLNSASNLKKSVNENSIHKIKNKINRSISLKNSNSIEDEYICIQSNRKKNKCIKSKNIIEKEIILDNTFEKLDKNIKQNRFKRQIKKKLIQNNISVYHQINETKFLENSEKNLLKIKFDENFKNNKKNIDNSSSNSTLDINKQNSDSIRIKTPKKIKIEMQKVFKTAKGEDFLYRQVNNDPETIKKMIIDLLGIPKIETEFFKYHRDLTKSLVVDMKNKVYFWKNIIDFIYPKIFINKIDHKKIEERIIGEGLFKLNVQDLRYHRKNKSLRLELKNSLNDDYRQDNEEVEENQNLASKSFIENIIEKAFSTTKDKIKEYRFKKIKNFNQQNNKESDELKSEYDKDTYNEYYSIERDSIFRNIQQTNFASNVEKIIKPSTLKKVNTKRKIELTNLCRLHQSQNKNHFESNNKPIFNISFFNNFHTSNKNEGNYDNDQNISIQKKNENLFLEENENISDKELEENCLKRKLKSQQEFTCDLNNKSNKNYKIKFHQKTLNKNSNLDHIIIDLENSNLLENEKENKNNLINENKKYHNRNEINEQSNNKNNLNPKLANDYNKKTSFDLSQSNRNKIDKNIFNKKKKNIKIENHDINEMYNFANTLQKCNLDNVNLNNINHHYEDSRNQNKSKPIKVIAPIIINAISPK